MKLPMLTTVDNPWNPGTHWDEWFAYDTLKGYNTSGVLERAIVSSEEISKPDQIVSVEIAIDEIIRSDPFGIYKKIYIDG